VANDPIHEVGGCLCGAVRYRAVAGKSQTVTHCHCRMCRKANGGTLATWVEFPVIDFVVTKGEPRHFRSSDVAERTFCGGCGCQLSFHAVANPDGPSDSIWLALGSLDRPGDIAPTHHIFTDNQLPRLHVFDDLPRWPNQLPWIRPEDELPEPTAPEQRHDDQPVAAVDHGEAHEGGCLCGSVRYRAVVGEARIATHCHCGMCRRSGGATLVSWVQVPVADFVFTSGQPLRFRSSPVAERLFCGTCGCQLTFQFADNSADHATSVWITLGSTDRPEDFDPANQVFTDDRLSWLHISASP
jgi:hypothetical protein